MQTDNVRRFEIIDHRPCEECDGTGWVIVPDPSPDHMEEPRQQECGGCYGLGTAGRTVIAKGNIEIEVRLQDNDTTLKVFISEGKNGS